MSPEHTPDPAGPKPEARPFEMGPSADAFIEAVCDHATSRRQARRIRDLYEREGDDFAVFLTLPGVDPYDPHVEERYLDCRVGAYASRDEFLRDQIEHHDWNDALKAFLAQEGIPEGFVAWNYESLWEDLLRGAYDLVEYGGLLHAFLK